MYFILWNGDIFNRDQHLQKTALLYGNGQLIRSDVYSAINFLLFREEIATLRSRLTTLKIFLHKLDIGFIIGYCCRAEMRVNYSFVCEKNECCTLNI